MPWWGWLVVGAALLAAEMFLLDAQFYLVFLGISAALVGLFGWAGIDLPEWGEWLTFAALSLLTMIAFRQRLYQLVKGRTGFVEERVSLGDRIVVPINLCSGETCRVDYRGSTWSARNVGEASIEAGKEAVISHVDGLTLHVRAA
jgi:inner membrane protein